MLNRRNIVTSLLLAEFLLMLSLSAQPVHAQVNEKPSKNTDPNKAAIIRPAGNVVSSDQGSKAETERGDRNRETREFPRLNPRSNPTNGTESTPNFNAITAPIITMVTSLMIVLGLFGAFVWLSRKLGTRRNIGTSVTQEVFEKLGSVIFDQRTQIHVIRFANRILLVSQTEGSLRTLCEITEHHEMEELLKLMGSESTNEFANAVKTFED